MLATVVLVQLQLQSAQMHPGGHPACPCIDPWSVVADDPRSCRELNINRELHFGVTNGTAQCVPLDYGASVCQSWDNATWNRACLTAEGTVPDSGAPEWCSARWCCAFTTANPFANSLLRCGIPRISMSISLLFMF